MVKRHLYFLHDIPGASTDLKRDFGNTERSLCNFIKLKGVKHIIVMVVSIPED